MAPEHLENPNGVSLSHPCPPSASNPQLPQQSTILIVRGYHHLVPLQTHPSPLPTSGVFYSLSLTPRPWSVSLVHVNLMAPTPPTSTIQMHDAFPGLFRRVEGKCKQDPLTNPLVRFGPGKIILGAVIVANLLVAATWAGDNRRSDHG